MNAEVKKYLEEQKAEVKRMMNSISADFSADYADITSNSYIDDLLTEYADQQVDIYNADLLEWAKSNLALIEEARVEFGKSDEFMHDIMSAQFLDNEQQLNSDKGGICCLLVINYLLDNNEDITKEEAEDILAEVGTGEAERVSDLLDIIETEKESRGC